MLYGSKTPGTLMLADGFGKGPIQYHRFPVDNVGCNCAGISVKPIKMGI